MRAEMARKGRNPCVVVVHHFRFPRDESNIVRAYYRNAMYTSGFQHELAKHLLSRNRNLSPDAARIYEVSVRAASFFPRPRIKQSAQPATRISVLRFGHGSMEVVRGAK